MDNKADAAVVRLTGTGIDCFDSHEPSECWAKAMAHANYKGDLDEFIAAAKRRGLMANQIRGMRSGHPALYRLFIPATNLGGWDGRS